jgi:hypothetical protein
MRYNSSETALLRWQGAAQPGSDYCFVAGAKQEPFIPRRKGPMIFIRRWYAWVFILRRRKPKFGFFDAFRSGLWLAQG